MPLPGLSFSRLRTTEAGREEAAAALAMVARRSRCRALRVFDLGSGIDTGTDDEDETIDDDSDDDGGCSSAPKPRRFKYAFGLIGSNIPVPSEVWLCVRERTHVLYVGGGWGRGCWTKGMGG